MEEEEHAKVADCPVPAERLRSRRGIEVGHIFAFGTKYSASMGFTVQTADGGQVHPQMGSYGIGVSRLMGAIIEASHDDNGHRLAGERRALPGRPDQHARRRRQLRQRRRRDLRPPNQAGVETLYDDRDERGGAKFATMDLIGLPWQLIVGPKGLEKGVVELKRRATGEREELHRKRAGEADA